MRMFVRVFIITMRQHLLTPPSIPPFPHTNQLEKFAKLLLAMEIRSTQKYWHMRNATTMYDPDFAANKMVGVVGGLDATCHTWFGEKFEFVVRAVGACVRFIFGGWVGG